MRRSWIVIAAAIAAIATFAAGVEVLSFDSGNSVALAIADGLVGAGLLGAALVARRHRADGSAGTLMGAAGLTWLAGTLWSPAVFLHRGPLVHLHLSYPSGRLRWWPATVTVVAVYAVSAIEAIAGSDELTLVIATVVAVVALRRFALASGTARRAGVPALIAALAFAAALSLGALNRQLGWQSDRHALWIYNVVVLGTVLILLVDLLRGRWADAVVSGLVVDLGRQSGTGSLRDELARALGDPTLALGYWRPAEQRYVDDGGQVVGVGSESPGRTVTVIDHDGAPIAVLVHDVAVLDDPALVVSATAAARMAFANARLRAETKARVDELATSRRRLIEAADEQRRRLGRELSDEVDCRLGRAGELIASVQFGTDEGGAAPVADVKAELGDTKMEINELANGIHPQALTDGGLQAAVPALACRARIPVSVDVSIARLPAEIEVALYFVCSEALANVAKHSRATGATVLISAANGAVTAIVADDGCGGADSRLGSGLRGLADRVEAFGGRLEVDSQPGAGTLLTATIPLPPDSAASEDAAVR